MTDVYLEFLIEYGPEYVVYIPTKIGMFIEFECNITEVSAMACMLGKMLNQIILFIEENEIAKKKETRNQHVALKEILGTFDIFDLQKSGFIDHILENKELVLKAVTKEKTKK